MLSGRESLEDGSGLEIDGVERTGIEPVTSGLQRVRPRGQPPLPIYISSCPSPCAGTRSSPVSRRGAWTNSA